MSFLPYDPFTQLADIRKDFDRFFNEFPTAFQSAAQVGLRLYELDDEVVATCHLPGIRKKEDVEVDIANNMLTIRAKVNHSTPSDGEVHRKENHVSQFQQSVSLPGTISTEDVYAVFQGGVLEVRMPKLGGHERKAIDIKFHD
ncbi:Hsp20/alpha crystallin family protein [Aureibacillus halotolerans]|uniref:HSP20 family protein n=1 Tax=Aureibacillus halotolerans TaxID=1508390 RepID=A0A4R6U511_9BACI|nr:Hsp20/alpha crystallin family protein [Aureibacillus halotolerans]TDQ40816.1 HSP20 family protein [Aureibacillus halotolerans]